jgi:hypothetical protein
VAIVTHDAVAESITRLCALAPSARIVNVPITRAVNPVVWADAGARAQATKASGEEQQPAERDQRFVAASGEKNAYDA